MKSHTIKLKHVDMLCHRCVMNVAKTLSQIRGIEELKVELKTHYIMLKYSDPSITEEMIKSLIQESLENGRVILLH